MQHYQVIIIGGGPGGYEAAIRLNQYEIPCLVIEKARLGGICLNWGCIPTKALVRSAELLSDIREAESFGLPNTPVAIDYTKIWQRKNAVVEQLVGGIEYLFRKRKIPLVNTEAIAVRQEDGSYIISTTSGEDFSCEYLVLATGSEAKSLPGIEINEENIMSSTGILKLESLPKSLAVVGGGVIGCEFASIFATFGVQVSIIEFLPRIVALEEEEISKRLAISFKKAGIKVITGKGVQSISSSPEGMILNLTDGSTLTAEKVLMSVGRNPVNSLQWNNLSPNTERGAIVIDDAMRTSLNKVYAIGDVTAKLQLAHTASKQGLMAVEHIVSLIKGKESHIPTLEYINIPRCTFTNPEIASVGYTETEARAKFGDLVIGKFPFAANGKAMAMGNTNGFVKTIARKDTEEIVGMHIMGPHAAELIAQGAILIANKSTAENVETIVFAHPTLSEAIMEAIHDLRNLSIHKI
ncbi:MAG: dihydrolipoyl dehydrogenase [Candidatus Cloacimonetes bacterium]|nr:dihydrolipoyl dehydrogenase [Candidatus Cloacimonadota bacterium]